MSPVDGGAFRVPLSAPGPTVSSRHNTGIDLVHIRSAYVCMTRTATRKREPRRMLLQPSLLSLIAVVRYNFRSKFAARLGQKLNPLTVTLFDLTKQVFVKIIMVSWTPLIAHGGRAWRHSRKRSGCSWGHLAPEQEKQNAPTGRNSEDRQKITPHFLSSLDFKTDDSKGAANGVNRGRQNNLKIIKKL